MGVAKFVTQGVTGASKPTETRVCRTTRQSRHHHEASFRPCSILGRSPGARCHARGGLSALSSALMYYDGCIRHEQHGQKYGIKRWPLFRMFYCIPSMKFQSGPCVSGRISEVSAIENVR